MPIASRAVKQRVIEALKNSNSKYSKPFDRGRMAVISVMGGNWEEYAAIVMDMVAADTLLDIDLRQEKLVQLTQQVLASQQLTNRLLMRQLGLSEDQIDAELVAALRSADAQSRPAGSSGSPGNGDTPLRRVEPDGPVDLKPQVVELLWQQAQQGDEGAVKALMVRGLVEEVNEVDEPQ